MTRLLFTLILLVGLINFLPVVGILSADRLESAYGVTLLSDDMVILMRHRALLFGLIGGFAIYAAFVHRYRNPAMLLAGLSMIGFVVLAHLTGNYNQNLHRILIVDYVGILILAIAVLIQTVYLKKHTSTPH